MRSPSGTLGTIYKDRLKALWAGSEGVLLVSQKKNKTKRTLTK